MKRPVGPRRIVHPRSVTVTPRPNPLAPDACGVRRRGHGLWTLHGRPHPREHPTQPSEVPTRPSEVPTQPSSIRSRSWLAGPTVPGMDRRPISPVWVVLAGIASAQLGAAVAKNLFGRVDPTGMVWLRMATAALVFVVIARPRTRRRTRTDWLTVIAFGVALCGMNWATYQAIARIPLGLAVAIGFRTARARRRPVASGPRPGLGRTGRPRGRAAGLRVHPSRPCRHRIRAVGAAMWATYIVLSARTGRQWDGIEGLAVASVVATALLAPLRSGPAGRTCSTPRSCWWGRRWACSARRSPMPAIWWRCGGSGPTCSAS